MNGEPFDRRLFVEVSAAVAEAALASGVASADLTDYRARLEERIDQLRSLGYLGSDD